MTAMLTQAHRTALTQLGYGICAFRREWWRVR